MELPTSNLVELRGPAAMQPDYYSPAGPVVARWLPPLWVAMVMSLAMSVTDILARKHPATRWLEFADAVVSLAFGVYFFTIVWRLTKVLESLPEWWGSYSPTGVVLRLLVPIYNLWVLYYWAKEIGRYLDWRLNRSSGTEVKFFTGFIVMVVVSCLGDVGSIVGGTGIMGLFYLFYVPLRRVLGENPPVNSRFGRGDLSLGIR